jgi:cation:H+ antiporter
MIQLFWFILGTVVVIFAANYLVDGASGLAKKFRVSDLVIGLTIVSFGTSAPELVVSVIAALDNNTDISLGNVLGSNLFNILFILGFSSIIRPIVVHSNTVWKEIPLAFLAVLVLYFLAADKFLNNSSESILFRGDALVLLSFFAIFIYYSVNQAKNEVSISSSNENANQLQMPIWKSALFISLGLTGLILGGKWMVNSAVEMAVMFNISQAVIGVTIVAGGTSIPELATSIVAAYKGKDDIAIGNVVGSNIFNVFFIVGVSGLISPLPFKTENFGDLIANILAAIVLFLLVLTSKSRTIGRWGGALLVLIFVVYAIYLIQRA